MDLAFIKSLLEAEAIQYYVHNDHFGSLKIGPKIDLFNSKTIFVQEEDSERAKELIAGYLAEQSCGEVDNKNRSASAYSFTDRLRVIFETLVFWWFIPPGRRWKKKQSQEKKESLSSH